MKNHFDLLVTQLLENDQYEFILSHDRKRYTTQAPSKEKAICNIAWKIAEKFPKERQKLEYSKVKNNIKVISKNPLITEEKVKRDRCLRKADQVYGKKTSAYKSGAVVKCRKGKIWKKKK
jgi:hypothetical protein